MIELKKNILLFSITVIISLFGGEMVLRRFGFRPWKISEINISVDPGGKFYRTHPVLGYSPIPGFYKVTLKDGYTWTTTHGPDGYRITEPLISENLKNLRKEIWIFGCSYTYGWSLNDNETYPWQLQKRYPQKRVINFGAPGYGNINFYLQFLEALKTRTKPDVIIVTYASFHDARNTMLRKRGKRVIPYSKALGTRWRPCARLNSEGGFDIKMKQLEYKEFPLMRYSAIIHSLEKIYNDIEDKYHDSYEVSKAILLKFHDIAKEKGVKLIVVAIDVDEDTVRMLDSLARLGIVTGDISIDLSQRQYRNLPHDGHPNTQANQIYAEKLMLLLEEKIF